MTVLGACEGAETAMAKNEVMDFVRGLLVYKGQLSRHEILTLRGMATHGNLDGARKGPETILRRWEDRDKG